MNSVRPIQGEQLRTLTPARLNAYRKRLLGLAESVAGADWTDAELAQRQPDRVYSKDDPRWPSLMAAVTSLSR